MKALIAAGAFFLAAHAGAALPATVKRGNLEVRVKVEGTVVPDDIFRINSSIEGRVEGIATSTFAWHEAGEPLAFLATRELAAMLDAKGAQNANILEDRWQRIYRPTPARCTVTCFVLKSFLKKGTWVKPDSVLFEAAGKLKLVGRVRPEDAHWVRDGQDLIFWPSSDPKRILKGRVARFILDIQGDKVSPGASFTLLLTSDRYLEPGTDWEGYIIPMSKKDVLYVPTAALIRNGDNVYLPVRISTGITTQGLTEISAGAEEKRDVLVLDDAQLFGAERHKQEVDLEAMRRRIRAQQDETASSPELGADPEPDAKRKPGKHAAVIDSTDYGEDPYAEPQ